MSFKGTAFGRVTEIGREAKIQNGCILNIKVESWCESNPNKSGDSYPYAVSLWTSKSIRGDIKPGDWIFFRGEYRAENKRHYIFVNQNEFRLFGQ